MSTAIDQAPVAKAKTAREEFLEWYRDQKANHGLVDIKFFPGDTSQASEEDFYGAINGLNRAFESGRSEIATDL